MQQIKESPTIMKHSRSDISEAGDVSQSLFVTKQKCFFLFSRTSTVKIHFIKSSFQSVKVMSYGRVVEVSTSRCLIRASDTFPRHRSLDTSTVEQALYLVDRVSRAGDPEREAKLLTKVGPL